VQPPASDTGPIKLPPVESSAPAPKLERAAAKATATATATAKKDAPLASAARIDPVVARKPHKEDWTSPDDFMEVLDEQPLPPPPVAPVTARKGS
jgi:hypothetical protein